MDFGLDLTPTIGASTNNYSPFSLPADSLQVQYDAWKKANPNINLAFGDWKNQMGGNNNSENASFNINPLTGTKNNVVATNGSVSVSPNNVSDVGADKLNEFYNNDLDIVNQNKKYLIGNAIGQSALNLTNLSQAWAKRPNMVGIGSIPSVEYPNVTGAELAGLNASEGRYRSGVARLAEEKGLSPAVRIGAEANVLSSDIEGRNKIAQEQNTNKIGEINANTGIAEANINNQYAAKSADTQRNDTIEGNRSAIFSQGLNNVARIGSGLAEGMIEQNNQKNSLEVANYYLQQYHAATTEAEKNNWLAMYINIMSGKSKNVATNSYITPKEMVGVKEK